MTLYMFQTVFWIFARNCWVKTKVSDGALSWWRLRHGAFEILPSEPVGMSHNQFPPPQQCREWSDVDPDGRALEFVQHFQELCSFCISQRVCHRQVMCDRSWTGHVIETSLHDSSIGPGRLVESLWVSPYHLSQDWHKIWCTHAVPFSDPLWKSPQATYTCSKQTRVKTVHFHPAMCNLPHWFITHGSPTIYRCFALPHMLYRWRHQSRKFWIPPCNLL